MAKKPKFKKVKWNAKLHSNLPSNPYSTEDAKYCEAIEPDAAIPKFTPPDF